MTRAVVNVVQRPPLTGTPTPGGTVVASNRGVSASGCEPVSNPQTVTTSTGLQYVDECVGNGPVPKAGDTVVVHYTGTLTDGQKFDSSRDRNQPFTFKLGQGEVIRGWDEGFATMKLGTKRKLTIPPELGYGSRGAGGAIPPNAILLFDVELLEIR